MPVSVGAHAKQILLNIGKSSKTLKISYKIRLLFGEQVREVQLTQQYCHLFSQSKGW